MAYTTLDETQTEIIENFGLLMAIKEGEDTATVDREEVFQVLEGAS